MRFAFREVSRNFNERTFEGTYGPLARYRFAAENRGNEGQYAHRKGQWQRRYGMSWRYFTLRGGRSFAKRVLIVSYGTQTTQTSLR
jgi:hypothetical protein